MPGTAKTQLTTGSANEKNGSPKYKAITTGSLRINAKKNDPNTKPGGHQSKKLTEAIMSEYYDEKNKLSLSSEYFKKIPWSELEDAPKNTEKKIVEGGEGPDFECQDEKRKLPTASPFFYCSQCGTKLGLGEKFCFRCGSPVREEALPGDHPHRTVPLQTHVSATFGTKWLKFWNYFSLPVGGIFWLLIFIKSPTFEFITLLFLSVAILQLSIAYGLHKRKLWAWQWNWVILVLTYISIIIPKQNPYRPIGTDALTVQSALLLVIASIVWMWPNYIYWKKRRVLFS
jgi:hypothetical protein